MIRRPRFLSPQERVKSPTHFNFQLPQKQITQTYSQIGPYLYDSHHPIGKGQFSIVYRGYEINKPNNIVAVKIITIQQNNAIQKIMIDNEINILSKIDHENILKLYYYRQTSTTVYLVTQYCRKGDLLQILSKSILPEDIALKYILQLAKALHYLHSMQYVHGDVKSANILISDFCVLADFGFSQEFNKNQTAYLIGTPVYMAPEVLFRNEVSAAADIWSLGSVLFEMVYGYPPFYAEQEALLRQALQSFVDSKVLHFPNTGVSRKIQALITELMRCDPNDRLTALNVIHLLEPKIINSSLNPQSGADTPKKQIEDQEINETKKRQPNMRFYQVTGSDKTHNVSVTKQQSLRKLSNGRTGNNGIVCNKSKQIELIDLVRFFYKVYLEFKENIDLEISIKFLFLKLVNIYYIIYLEEQAKIQKKVVFIPCQNDFFQLEREIKYNYGFYLKDEEFNKIFYSKFQLTSDFIKYFLDQLQVQQLLHKDNEYGDRIRKSLQIINMLIDKSVNPQISSQVQLIHSILY